MGYGKTNQSPIQIDNPGLDQINQTINEQGQTLNTQGQSIQTNTNNITTNTNNITTNTNNITTNTNNIASNAAQLADNAQHTKGAINITSYSNLVTNNDWTSAITQSISDSPSGGTIYFPEGSYNHKGITITKPINFRGYGKYSTFLINIGTGDAVTINANVERGAIRDICIQGNGTQANGVGATSGNGIVLNNNAVIWLFENVWVRYHGKHGIYSYGIGSVNNINIISCEIENNLLDGVYTCSKDSSNQINNINIKECNIAGQGGNGVSVWGNNINIYGNTIQGNNGYGIKVSSDNSVNYSSNGINIRDNYFEANKAGFINIKAAYTNPNVAYIIQMIIEGNMGGMNQHETNAGVTSLVTISSNMALSSGRAVRQVHFLNNGFTSDVLNILDGGNTLNSDSVVYIPLDGSGKSFDSVYVNLGSATIQRLKRQVINGYISSKGVTYSSPTLSGNLTAQTEVYFPLPPNITAVRRIQLPYQTDIVSGNMRIEIWGRAINSTSAYTRLYAYIPAINGTSTLDTGMIDPISLIGYEDYYLGVMQQGTGGTYFYIGNPYIMYV